VAGLSIWNSYALICTSTAATARKLRVCKNDGVVMKAKVKTVQSDQVQSEGQSPYSVLACILLLLAAGLFIKLAATTQMFHLFH
jgi:hypothetical protein